MAEVVLITVNHNGTVYPVDTPVAEIKDLTEDQKAALIAAGAVGEPVVHSATKAELDAKDAEIAALKEQLRAATEGNGAANKSETKK